MTNWLIILVSCGVFFFFCLFLKRDRWSFSLRSCVSVPRLRYSYLSVEESPALPTPLPLHPTHAPQRPASTMPTQHLTRLESFLHTDWAMALFAHCVIGFYWKPVKPLVFHQTTTSGAAVSLLASASLSDWLKWADCSWAKMSCLKQHQLCDEHNWKIWMVEWCCCGQEFTRGTQRSSQTDRWAAMSNPHWFFFFSFISFDLVNCQHILSRSLKIKKHSKTDSRKKWMVLFRITVILMLANTVQH